VDDRLAVSALLDPMGERGPVEQIGLGNLDWGEA
jgi:hypothetical protein